MHNLAEIVEGGSPIMQRRVQQYLIESRNSARSRSQVGAPLSRDPEQALGLAKVVLGQDDISDAYYPYGRNSMLEVAFLNSHLLWMTTEEDMEKLYDMITVDVATAMGIKDFELAVGNQANLVVLQDENVLEAFRNHQPVEHLISHGQVVDLDRLKE